ncbi:MAG TPA: MotA/TolQ/ExbB proton channel family protein [Gemmatimonadales bacterium]|nr:MotA/TolQ/ExbB proton channel family protein [Gemmatimonadales bacterium]
MQMSLIELWGHMGWFARSIVFVMVIMSVLSLGVAFSKWWRFRKMTSETRKFAPEFSRFLQEEQMEGAISLAHKYKVSHVARVLSGALEEIKPLLRDGHQISASDINSAERAIERNTLILISELKRGTGILATVGATAPFVGLLGTTMGIVNAFQGMASGGGSGGLGAISAGIAEALITTAFGLLVAIPAVWLYNFFQTKMDFLTVEMTYTGKELVDYLIKNVGSEFGRSSFTKDFPAQVASASGHISQ